ncbi:thiazolylpeptide-type bacteriocin [Acrocarpospora sp. B8E8]|uniref:thiazolylpeptide-type bacteriocin n=1 Tax=Acrocarpospora sp. B8E8 TaxID=3153572 RepID=UPI00325D93AB
MNKIRNELAALESEVFEIDEIPDLMEALASAEAPIVGSTAGISCTSTNSCTSSASTQSC